MTSPYWQYDQYQATKNHLERQASFLHAERNKFQNSNTINQHIKHSHDHYPQSTFIIPVVQINQDQNKSPEIIGKLQEIIRLCKSYGPLSNEQMNEVAKIQNDVLNYLQRTRSGTNAQVVKTSLQPPFRTKTDPALPIQEINQVSHTWNKEQSQPILSQNTLDIIGQIEKRALAEIIHLQQERDNIKRQKQIFATELQRVKIEFAKLSAQMSKNAQFQNVKGDFRVYTGQIQRLREENRVLKVSSFQTSKVKQENQLLREENQYLSLRLQTFENTTLNIREPLKIENRSTHYEYSNHNNARLIQGQYDSQITLYENQLKRATGIINELRTRLANVPGLEALHEEAQVIRKHTAQLLHLKSIGGHQSKDSIINQLQKKLEQQQRGKLAFLQELKSFKQRYIELQEENRALRNSKVTLKSIPRIVDYSPSRESRLNEKLIKNGSNYLGEYEQTLNELKMALS